MFGMHPKKGVKMNFWVVVLYVRVGKKANMCDIDQMTHNYLNEETETIDLGRKTAPSILLLVDATFFTQDITNTNK